MKLKKPIHVFLFFSFFIWVMGGASILRLSRVSIGGVHGVQENVGEREREDNGRG